MVWILINISYNKLDANKYKFVALSSIKYLSLMFFIIFKVLDEFYTQ